MGNYRSSPGPDCTLREKHVVRPPGALPDAARRVAWDRLWARLLSQPPPVNPEPEIESGPGADHAQHQDAWSPLGLPQAEDPEALRAGATESVRRIHVRAQRRTS